MTRSFSVVMLIRSRYLPIVAGILFSSLYSSFASAAKPNCGKSVKKIDCLESKHEIQQIWEEGQKLARQGMLDEALVAAKRVHQLQLACFGQDHVDSIAAMIFLAESLEAKKDFTSATTLRRSVVQSSEKLYGQNHWIVPARMWELKTTQLLSKMTVDQRDLLDNSARLSEQASIEFNAAHYGIALEYLLRTAEIQKQLLGEFHPHYATTLDEIGGVYARLGEFERAIEYLESGLEIRKNSLGVHHPEYARSLSNLAAIHIQLGNHVKAEPLLKEAVRLTKENVGEDHFDYALALNNLAFCYLELCDYARARPCFERSLSIVKRTLGEEHPHFAVSLLNLAKCLEAQGDIPKAKQYCQLSVELNKKHRGERHPAYANSLNNMAALHEHEGNSELAEKYYQEALGIRKEVLGTMHPDYAVSLNNLASILLEQGKYEQAEPLFLSVLEIREKTLGKSHPEYAAVHNSLGYLYELQNEDAKAKAKYEEALEIVQSTLGDHHPDIGQTLLNLSFICNRQEDYAQAESLAVESLHIMNRVIEFTSAGQSERQQLLMLYQERPNLDLYLSYVMRNDKSSKSAYDELLAWKGVVLARQWRQRSVMSQPAIAEKYSQLQQTTSQLAALALSLPEFEERDSHQKQLAELSDKKQEIERELSSKSREFSQAIESVKHDKVQASLPPETALVDLLICRVYAGGEQPVRGRSFQHRLLAFVVSREKVVGPIDLASAEELQTQIDLWRKTLGQSKESAAAGKWLREKLWDALEEHLKGAKIVLVSPDGALGKLPLVALPGKQPGTYLLEEDVLIATVPVPQMLPELLADLKEETARPSLLSVGGVDYDANAEAKPKVDNSLEAKPLEPKDENNLAANASFVSHTRAAARSGNEPLHFGQLAHTLDEVRTIEKQFSTRFTEGTTLELSGTGATESAFRAAVPKHRYLHLATHGYFAPASLRSALAPKPGAERDMGFIRRESDFDVHGFHPGLLSGIALAGANRPPDPEKDDGILTAEEVATLNLSQTDLVVLSACETGLGQVAGGEGLLGLQRAFQVSGARTVVASLWNVGDAPTRALMEEFYKRLWKEEKPKSKLAALRDAQLWMLRHAQGQAIQGGNARGLTALDDQPADQDNLLPPFYWAGFVLSGDWR